MPETLELPRHPVLRGHPDGLATAAVTVAGWIGGDLVVRHGWRVRPAEEAEIVARELDGKPESHYFELARHQVEKFEREKTLLG